MEPKSSTNNSIGESEKISLPKVWISISLLPMIYRKNTETDMPTIYCETLEPAVWVENSSFDEKTQLKLGYDNFENDRIYHIKESGVYILTLNIYSYQIVSDVKDDKNQIPEFDIKINDTPIECPPLFDKSLPTRNHFTKLSAGDTVKFIIKTKNVDIIIKDGVMGIFFISSLV